MTEVLVDEELLEDNPHLEDAGYTLGDYLTVSFSPPMIEIETDDGMLQVPEVLTINFYGETLYVQHEVAIQREIY